MHIAILTFDGFNELDSFIALGILNRLNQQNSNTVRVSIASPTPTVRSMNGIVVTATATLEEACAADAVVIGSGAKTREVVEDNLILVRGPYWAAKLGLLDGVPACTDDVSKPWVIAAGVEVVNQPFIYHGNVATAGGCLASHYLATWLIRRLFGTQAAKKALSYVVPVGEQEEYIKRALNHTEQEGVI